MFSERNVHQTENVVINLIFLRIWADPQEACESLTCSRWNQFTVIVIWILRVIWSDISLTVQSIFWSNMECCWTHSVSLFLILICNWMFQFDSTFCQVLSVKLDEWTNEQVDALAEMGGNLAVNKKYEAYTPGNLKKPNPNSFIDERSDFIR